MTRFLADENFNIDIVRGLRRQIPSLDIIRIHELGMAGWEDPDILEWAASNGRIVLTHDVGDMTKYAYARTAPKFQCRELLKCQTVFRQGELSTIWCI